MDKFDSWIGIAVLLGIGWVANRHAQRDRFPMGWHLLMLGTAIAHSIFQYFTVMGQDELSVAIGIAAIWFLVWIVLLFVLIGNNRIRDTGILCLYPIVHILIGVLSTVITGPQLRDAEKEGDRIFERIEQFYLTNQRYPESLNELERAGGIPILETGVGFWGIQEYQYSTYKDESFGLYILGFTGNRYRRTNEGVWAGDL